MMYAYLLHDITKWIPKYIMDKGYEYYEEGHVEDVEIQDKKIFAFVTGNAGDYEVIIDLEDFTESSCECPYENLANIWRQLFMIFKVLVRVRLNRNCKV